LPSTFQASLVVVFELVGFYDPQHGRKRILWGEEEPKLAKVDYQRKLEVPAGVE
jgi:hypothetical protein